MFGKCIETLNTSVFIGVGAGEFITSGSSNTCIGSYAGERFEGEKHRNVCLGVFAGNNINSNKNICIGNSAGKSTSDSTTTTDGH